MLGHATNSPVMPDAPGTRQVLSMWWSSQHLAARTAGHCNLKPTCLLCSHHIWARTCLKRGDFAPPTSNNLARPSDVVAGRPSEVPTQHETTPLTASSLPKKAGQVTAPLFGQERKTKKATPTMKVSRLPGMWPPRTDSPRCPPRIPLHVVSPNGQKGNPMTVIPPLARCWRTRSSS